jgi:hypothetical protein
VASEEKKLKLLSNPERYLSPPALLPPPLRVLVLGSAGSGCAGVSRDLSRALGLVSPPLNLKTDYRTALAKLLEQREASLKRELRATQDALPYVDASEEEAPAGEGEGPEPLNLDTLTQLRLAAVRSVLDGTSLGARVIDASEWSQVEEGLHSLECSDPTLEELLLTTCRVPDTVVVLSVSDETAVASVLDLEGIDKKAEEEQKERRAKRKVRGNLQSYFSTTSLRLRMMPVGLLSLRLRSPLLTSPTLTRTPTPPSPVPSPARSWLT